MFSCWERPNAESPYASPYDMALILRRISGVDRGLAPRANTWEATVVCRSSPEVNASIRPSSSERWAITRSSIWL